MKQKRVLYNGTESKRHQIIKAALGCFVDTGFVNTTMEDIRVRSKFSNGSIYHHFKSKDQLAAAVYLEGIIDYQRGLIDSLSKHSDARGGIFAIVEYHLKWIKNNRLWAQYLFSMRHAEFMKTSEDLIEQSNRGLENELSKWYKKMIMKGELRRLPSKIFISLILGPSQEYARLWLAGKQSSEKLDAAITELSEAAWNSLRA
jgi:AcrR family transcriptional regulator